MKIGRKNGSGEKFSHLNYVKVREESVGEGGLKPEKIWGDREGDAHLKGAKPFIECWFFTSVG